MTIKGRRIEKGEKDRKRGRRIEKGKKDRKRGEG
jgi:hypothetical protein